MSQQIKKIRLFTPGPTPIPEVVLQKMALPIIHHRTTLFEAEFAKLQDHLKWLFQTQNEVLSLTCTGSGAMEATLVSLFSAGDPVVVVNAGKFGERWVLLAQQFGLEVYDLKLPRGKTLNPDDLKSVLDQKSKQGHPYKAVLFQASETSTGTLLPIQEIAKMCQQYDALSVCDGITAVGIFNVPMDEWALDVLITGSQKALMLPPGLAFVSLSAKAWKVAESSQLPKYYFNLKTELLAQKKQQTAWTPAISLINGAVESLGMMRAQGLSGIFTHNERLALATRSACSAMGLELFSECPSNSLTAVKVPVALGSGEAIQKKLQDEHGVIITGGQDELKGKILRFSHFGYVDVFDIVSAICAVEWVLKEMKHPIAWGAGTSALMQEYTRLA